MCHWRCPNEAIEDDALGLVFPARVSLRRDWIMAGGRKVKLTSGMATTIEVKTGHRRVIEFLLTPLLRYRDEAIRER